MSKKPMEQLSDELHAHLTRRKREEGYTQAEHATASGVSREDLNRVLNIHRSRTVLDRCCTAAGISLEVEGNTVDPCQPPRYVEVEGGTSVDTRTQAEEDRVLGVQFEDGQCPSCMLLEGTGHLSTCYYLSEEAGA